jgi:hypothetical protein
MSQQLTEVWENRRTDREQTSMKSTSGQAVEWGAVDRPMQENRLMDRKHVYKLERDWWVIGNKPIFRDRNRPKNWKQANGKETGRQADQEKEPTVLKQTDGREIDLQLGNSPIDKETHKQILTNGYVTDWVAGNRPMKRKQTIGQEMDRQEGNRPTERQQTDEQTDTWGGKQFSKTVKDTRTQEYVYGDRKNDRR